MGSRYWKKIILQLTYGDQPTTGIRAKHSGEEESMGGGKWVGEDIYVFFSTDPSGRPSIQLVARETTIRIAEKGVPHVG